eukprot:1061827_1
MPLKMWVGMAALIAFVALCVSLLFHEELLIFRYHPSRFPKPPRVYWGKDPTPIREDPIQPRPFIPYNSIDESTFHNEDILNQHIHLWLQKEENNPFQHDSFISDDTITNYNELSMNQGTGYGIHYNDFHNLVMYYNHTFNWTHYKQIIQSFDHYMVHIGGIDIHFIHHKLNQHKTTAAAPTIDAILLLHGWPSSFYEYHRLLHMFQHQYTSHPIDIIIPSLPGYGFSEYPMHHTGFTTAAVAQILRQLMEQCLSYNHYIVVGGDWGSIVAHNMMYSVVEDVENKVHQPKLRGVLVLMPLTSPPPQDVLLLLFDIEFMNKYIANKYNVSMERVKKFTPFLKKYIGKTWDLTGYQHIHATRPSTIGIALQSSPIAHLAWIYEKYLHWSGGDGVQDVDGKRVISGDLSWDDVLVTNNIFYLNGKVASAIRYYAESAWYCYRYMLHTYIPEYIPIVIVRFEDDAFDSGFFEKWSYHNIVMNRAHKQGGHFPALEYPELLYNDIVQFIQIITSSS